MAFLWNPIDQTLCTLCISPFSMAIHNHHRNIAIFSLLWINTSFPLIPCLHTAPSLIMIYLPFPIEIYCVVVYLAYIPYCILKSHIVYCNSTLYTTITYHGHMYISFLFYYRHWPKWATILAQGCRDLYSLLLFLIRKPTGSHRVLLISEITLALFFH